MKIFSSTGEYGRRSWDQGCGKLFHVILIFLLIFFLNGKGALEYLMPSAPKGSVSSLCICLSHVKSFR